MWTDLPCRGAMRQALAACVLAAWAAALAPRAAAEVTVFQQGVSPSPEYSGCTDTYIDADRYSWRRGKGKLDHIWTAGSRKGLVRFDLTPLGKNRTVKSALLRLYLVEIPSPKATVPVRAVAREWDDTANWLQHSLSYENKKFEKNLWAAKGGDVDGEADFGAGKPGLVAKGSPRGGPFGHVVEMDVTKLVAAWVSGRRPNHGFLIDKEGYTAIRAASTECANRAYRPALAIEHYGAGEDAAGGARLELPAAAGPGAALSPLASTKGGRPGGAAAKVVRFGRNSNCAYRKGHMAGYAKQDVRFGGNWGWTPRLRVGGSGGDLNHAVFYFDLSAVPKGAAIKRVALRAFVDVGNTRLPRDEDCFNQVSLLSSRDDKRRISKAVGRVNALKVYSFGLFRLRGAGKAPGWSEDGFTFAERGPGKSWTAEGGGLTEATEPAPVAVCKVSEQWKDVGRSRDEMPETWLEWDVTGLARAWVGGKAPNRGVVLDGRLMGGEMVLFSDDWVEADRRPYLEVELEAELPPADGDFKAEALVPEGDYWVEPMRKAHAKWKGTKGSFSQYGDSITVTMAFWTPLRYSKPKNCDEAASKAYDTVRKHLFEDSWRKWKGPAWGCQGSTTIRWAFGNIDGWQKKMNPESAVTMWGTNDAYLGPQVPVYTEMYTAVIDRILADGGVPIITTLPPRYTQRSNPGAFLTVWNFRLATIYIARARKVPMIDLWAEMVSRRPEDWDGKMKKFKDQGYKGYNVPTMMAGDGIHPSNFKELTGDWSEEGLRKNGFNLRNCLTLKKWHEVYTRVLAPEQGE